MKPTYRIDKVNEESLHLTRIARAIFLARNNPTKSVLIVKWVHQTLGTFAGLFGTLLSFTALINKDTAESFQYVGPNGLLLFLCVVLLFYLAYGLYFISDCLLYYKESTPQALEKYTPRQFAFATTKCYVDKTLNTGLAIGGAVELTRGPHIDRNLSNNGWKPHDVIITIEDGIVPFPEWDQLSTISDLNDGPKYSLQTFEHGLSERNNRAIMSVKRSCYNHTTPVHKYLSKNPDFRLIEASAEGVHPSIPSSLCLHFVCLLSNGSILGLKRSGTDFSNNTVSLSFEEQVSVQDETVDSKTGVKLINIESTIRRALCEEVFPLRDTVNGKKTGRGALDAWNEVQADVRYANVWSLLSEETILGNALMVVCQLNLSEAELHERRIEIGRKYNDVCDNEGKYVIFDAYQASLLAKYGEAKCRLFKSTDEVGVRAVDLSDKSPAMIDQIQKMGEMNIFPCHPTTMYRAIMVDSCVNG